jgi:hypothetical protein
MLMFAGRFETSFLAKWFGAKGTTAHRKSEWNKLCYKVDWLKKCVSLIWSQKKIDFVSGSGKKDCNVSQGSGIGTR